MPEALELHFTEKSLKGDAGVNMGVVMLEGYYFATCINLNSSLHRGGTFFSRALSTCLKGRYKRLSR